MTTDDQDGDDPQQGRGDTDKPNRDARGRWLPDHCPNPKGRPTKKPKKIIHESDLQVFAYTVVDVAANGQKERMVRRTALLNKMFEGAMKGRVSMQRFLYKEFEKNDKLLAAHRVRYDQLIFDWYLDNPDLHSRDMPFEVEMEIDSLRSLLNHYYPGQYLVGGMSANDDGDDDDGCANL